MTDAPLVEEGQWILVGSARLNGLVLSVYGPDHLGVGYYQNHSKAIKEDVVWDGTQWEFDQSGLSGSYLRGPEAAAVKRGPSASLLRRG